MDQSGRAVLRSANRKTNPARRASVNWCTRSRYNACIDATNAEPKPFRWTSSADDILVAINRFCKRTIDEHHSAIPKTSELGH
jgi:hypothetical protein